MYGTITTNESKELTTTGNTSSFHLHLSGDFGSGTVTIGFIAEDGTTKTIAEGTFTEAVDKVLDMPLGSKIVITLSGAVAPSVYYQITARLLM